MTTAREHDWDLQRALWWIPAGSPGTLGDPEIWIDESAMDMYARGDAAPAVTVRFPADRTGISMLRALIRFTRHGNDLDPPVVYQVISRRFSQENGGRPYYVARWPD